MCLTTLYKQWVVRFGIRINNNQKSKQKPEMNLLRYWIWNFAGIASAVSLSVSSLQHSIRCAVIRTVTMLPSPVAVPMCVRLVETLGALSTKAQLLILIHSQPDHNASDQYQCDKWKLWLHRPTESKWKENRKWNNVVAWKPVSFNPMHTQCTRSQ